MIFTLFNIILLLILSNKKKRKNHTMKKIILITVLSFYGLQAQMGLTAVVGAASVNVVSEDEDMQDYLGAVIAVPEIAVEKQFGPVVAGVGYYSGGYEIAMDFFGYTMTSTTKFNYLSLYGIYPHYFGKVGLGAGLGLGIPMGGTVEIEMDGETESEDIESDDIDTDVSLILGAGYRVTEQIGVRTYLRMGLVDFEEDAGMKNTGLGVALSYSF
ncbi:MAG: outer membrane beta-barrel protein [Candidatus Marinimicrobia bacterium]|nr:outer membrane beta-barrel protein [Candidatus Neomarinimicrobiota bacterium]